MLERKSKAVAGLLFLSVLAGVCSTVYTQDAPAGIDAHYKRCFRYYIDGRSLKERVLNFVGLTDYKMGRSFALLAGVSKYQIAGPDGDLKEAHIDIEHLVAHLKDYEAFDEIVVLENENVTYNTLEYFLRTYFPSRLASFPKSRFLFAYSGHGMQGGSEGKEGLLLRSEATSLNDKDHAISLEALRPVFSPIIESSYHTLILINACYSGAFGVRTFGGGMYPRKPGAHAITAGGGAEATRADPNVGPGSIFFETIIRGLADGSADVVPKGGDGVITAEELFTFTKQEIQYLTRDTQNPTFTNLSLAAKMGGSFFFFNQRKFAEVGERPKWDPGAFRGFGTARKQELAKANKYYTERKFREAFNIYKDAANEGDTEAIMKVAHMIYYGQGVKADIEDARSLYQELAEKGNTDAMVALGQTYRDTYRAYREGSRDRQQALSWFNKAADAGSAVAMAKLGEVYYEGRIVKPDITKAVEWYKKAAGAGNSEAMRVLGLIYFDGRKGSSVDIDEALGWFRKAAEAGNYLAILKLASIYKEGSGGVEIDYSEAMRLFKLAASQGEPMARAEAIAEVGRLYEEGKGVEKSYSEASQWYQKGIDLGGPDAMAYFGRMYKEGRGVPKDYSKALELFDKASEIGSTLAIFEKGTMYEEGLGVEKDREEARRLYSSIAGDDGYEPANARLRIMSGQLR